MPLLEGLETDLKVMKKMTDNNTNSKLYYHPLESTLDVTLAPIQAQDQDQSLQFKNEFVLRKEEDDFYM